MIQGGHFRAAEILRDLPDAGVVGGDDHLGEGLGALATLDDMLDEGPARDEGERLAGKTAGTVAGRDDADDFHGE